jgi:hypothetical protein
MELALGLIAIIVIGLIIWFNRGTKGFDVNKDGKVDVADAKAAVTNTVEGVKATADVNKDGVVNAGDVKVAARAAKTAVTAVVRNPKPAGTQAKKPPAKKPAAKGGARKPRKS